MRMDTGRRLTFGNLRASAGSEWNFAVRPDFSVKSFRVLNGLFVMV
jgi:hypothetical protein